MTATETVTAEEDREKKILEELRKGTPWNVITKKYHVSTSTISQIKAKRSGTVPPTAGEIAAQTFNLFQQGKGPIDAVIELRQPVEVVEGLYGKWLELKGQVPIANDWRFALAEVIEMIKEQTNQKVSTPNDFGMAVAQLVVDHQRFTRLQYPCCDCGEATQVGEAEWKYLLEKGYFKTWGHADCIDKQEAEEARREKEAARRNSNPLRKYPDLAYA
jgi:hypothetical protein